MVLSRCLSFILIVLGINFPVIQCFVATSYRNQSGGPIIKSKAIAMSSSDATTVTPSTLLVSQGVHLEKIRLILASQSPRRKEILEMMGLVGKFDVSPSPLDEAALATELLSKNLCPLEYTRTLAEEKAKALALSLLQNIQIPMLVLGSDTIVDLDGHVLEKPADQADARRMLRSLSGVEHAVHTGVALYAVYPGINAPVLTGSFTETALVTFASLSDADIDAYVASGEPMDKAGAYGIQGIGGQFVESVQGDFFAVMGLPMHRTSRLIASSISEILQKI